MKKELLKEYCASEFENIAVIMKEIAELREKSSAPDKVAFFCTWIQLPHRVGKIKTFSWLY